MEKINITELTINDKELLRIEFIKVFNKINDRVKEIKKRYEENYIGSNKKIQNLQISTFGKILLLAKKVAVNTVISKFTGIDSVYLDNDTSFIRPNRIQQQRFYRECDLILLCEKVLTDMENGVNNIINCLQNADERQMNDLVTKIAENYNILIEKASVRETDSNLEYLLYPILYNLKMININEFDRFLIMRERKIGSGMDINILKEINNINESLTNANKPKQK